jgi:hypothetical protein
MALIGAFSGALAGLVLASILTSQGLLAVIAAFVAVVLALAVGRAILGSRAKLSLRSTLIVWHLILASVIGALAGHELSVDLRTPPSSVLVASMSGLLASLLISSLVIEIFRQTHRQQGD